MQVVMYYKGYHGSAEYCEESKFHRGRIEGISELITYDGEDFEELTLAFREAVDDYIAPKKKVKLGEELSLEMKERYGFKKLSDDELFKKISENSRKIVLDSEEE